MGNTQFDSRRNLQRLLFIVRTFIAFRSKNFFPVLLGVFVFYLIFYTSCANQGMPTGGDKDTIAPVVLKTIPALRGTNFTGSDLRFTFDEFIIPDEISEKLVISPPMKKKPIVKMKGKTLIIEFAEDQRKETTYSLDFKDAVADNNEKNPIPDFRFSYSTGPTFDSLRVSGYVKDALSQEPVEKALVLLHRMQDFTAFIDSIPDYIGKTDKEGLFMIDNIAPGSYKLYAVMDADNSLTYNQNGEKIAFTDSLIVPSATFVAETDTVIQGNDTLLVSGHVDYFPGMQYLMMFEEERFDQYLDSYKRTQANKCDFFFAESLSDSFSIKLLKPVPEKEWKFIETNLRRDSITVWITDTLISKTDTLMFDVKYEMLDTLDQLAVVHDTISLIFAAPKAPKQKRKKDEKPEIQTIVLADNINTSGHDLYQRIVIEAPEPLSSFDTSMVKLFSVIDSVTTELPIVVEKDSNSVRKYFIEYQWEENSNYLFTVDSAAARNMNGDPSLGIEKKFRTQKEDYYGKIILTISELTGPAIVQLLGNDKDEKVLQKIQVLENGEIEFPYLKPEKYKIRIILDSNQNGLWDTGYLANGLQPERVIYFPKIIKVRSNFEFKESIRVNYDPSQKKELIDEELEKEKARKKEQEKQKAKQNQGE
jgi:hypothetical protein